MKPHTTFFHSHNVKFPKFSCLFKKVLTPSKIDIIILGIISKVLSVNTDFLWICAKFSKNIQIFANFTRGMIGNETGHLVECVKLYGKCINKNET